MENPEVLLHRVGRVGHLILNRPAAMNALTHGMVKTITAALKDWENDDGVATVLLSGAGDRGLCAGGDIVAIYRDATGGGTATEEFWRDEYLLNAYISRYPKPYVAIMDGVVLGGGVGVSAHANTRVVTERSKIGMPETGIGFVPDVGGTYLLSHAPGELGTHVALTAASVTGADAVVLGMADHYLDSSDLPELFAALGGQDAAAAVVRFSRPVPESALAAQRSWIDEAYAADAVETILERLDGVGEPARKAAASIRAKSPTAVKVTLAALRRARELGSLAEVLDQEYRVSLRSLAGPDFAEGIRAQLIDKDRNPGWDPPRLEQVTDAAVEHYFSDLGQRELGLTITTTR